MLYKAKDILGCAVDAVDGEVGRIKDLYFDDETWGLRYVVVETGSWLNSQEVLVSPSAFVGADPAAGVFSTRLTCKQVKESPPVTSDMPVSRQYEERLHDYYGWMPYWDMPLYSAPGLYVYPPIGGLGPVVSPEDPAARTGDELAGLQDRERRRREEGDPHLRSFREVKGYHIETRDGRIGHVADLLVDPRSWRLTHLVIDTRNWIPGKLVVVDTGAVRGVDWGESIMTVAASKQQVRESPAYDPTRLVDDGYLSDLSAYYHRISGSGGRPPARPAERPGDRKPPAPPTGGLPEMPRGALWPTDLPANPSPS